jgi:hypothetical protein
MICNGAPTPPFPLLEQYNQWYRWNLSMMYAWCVFYRLPTEWLDEFNNLPTPTIE